MHFALPLETDGSDDSDIRLVGTSDPEVDPNGDKDKRGSGNKQQKARGLSVDEGVHNQSPPVDISFRSAPQYSLFEDPQMLALDCICVCRKTRRVYGRKQCRMYM